jgi:hypothetical protein
MSPRAGTRSKTHPTSPRASPQSQLQGRQSQLQALQSQPEAPAVTTGRLLAGPRRSTRSTFLGELLSQGRPCQGPRPRKFTSPPRPTETAAASSGPATPSHVHRRSSTTPGPDWTRPPRDIGRPTVRARRRTIHYGLRDGEIRCVARRSRASMTEQLWSPHEIRRAVQGLRRDPGAKRMLGRARVVVMAWHDHRGGRRD